VLVGVLGYEPKISHPSLGVQILLLIALCRKVEVTMGDGQPAAPAAASAEDLSSEVAKMDVNDVDNKSNCGGKKKEKGGGGGSNTSNSTSKQPPAPPRDWTAEMQADYDRILSVGEECISPAELKALITAKGRGSDHELGFNLYDGFEPSGRMHIAQVSLVWKSVH